VSFRLLLCVLAGVATTLGSLVMLIAHFRRPPALPPPPKPNFRVVSEEAVDEQTGEKVVYREITVSTKLAGQGLKKDAVEESVSAEETPKKAGSVSVDPVKINVSTP
jgi:hypothetical protein